MFPLDNTLHRNGAKVRWKGKMMLSYNETMKKSLNILLVCGAGASSSFMAAKMRMAAKERGLDLTITARSESEISNYIGFIDALLVGPHLNGVYEDAKEHYGRDFAVILMKKDYYAVLDGNKALDHVLEELEGYQDKKEEVL